MPIATLILPKENSYVANLAFGSNDHLDLRCGRRCRKGSLGSVGDGISLREISTRGTLHAWSWPERFRGSAGWRLLLRTKTMRNLSLDNFKLLWADIEDGGANNRPNQRKGKRIKSRASNSAVISRRQ
jgi:hypothetical protein